MLKQKVAMEWLEKGAILDFTTWGDNYPIYIRLNSEKKVDKISSRLLSKLKVNNQLILVKRETLSYVYKLRKPLDSATQSANAEIIIADKAKSAKLNNLKTIVAD